MIIKEKNGYIRYSEDDVEENTLVIDMVEVKEKRKGTGTKLVNQVIAIANKENKKLTLCAYPQDNTITLEELVKFYESVGFSVSYDCGDYVMMEF